jgi:hypothetical protein
MIDIKLVQSLKAKLDIYEDAAKAPAVDAETKAGIEMLGCTVRRMIKAVEDGRAEDAGLETLTFSRQASDAYFDQPSGFKDLAAVVSELRKSLGRL